MSAGASVVADSVAFSLGYNLKPMQRTVITAVLEGKDVFAVLPTGYLMLFLMYYNYHTYITICRYGKSLCFVTLPLAFDQLGSSSNSIVLVVGPLKALLKDQAINYYN
jgi:ATP-dependent DNA helicase RecQ